MVIGYRKGDVIKALQCGEINVLAHGCNCQSIMGAGIALQIAKEYPKVAEMDLELPFTPEQRLGRILVCKVGTQYILNCYTQLRFGKGVQIDYNAIRLVMRKLARYASMYNIGMPKIGSGLGGGDWSKIALIINEEIKSLVHVYEYLD